MNPEQWNRVQTLFKELIDVDQDTRLERLESVKTEDPLLFEELMSLLTADSESTSLLDGFAIDQIDLSELAERDGSKIGPFQIEEKIGSGGMGNVYLAYRVMGGFEQTVALKLIKFGMGSETAIRRFETERNILARLQHPNISRLLDGGLTNDDHPWFAMEYVEGEDLLSYCNRLNLSVEKRLGLFLEVTEAVQYAHKNLIVHRDLKPGNILVSGDDDKPQIKLLDFGISQIMNESAEDTGLKAMTRAYASPEQLRGESTSTSTDIYSLGVVLYQLLSGGHPKEEFRSENDHPKPISKEITAICEKAIHDDPANRFQNASDLDEEIEAWLNNRPVPSYSEKPTYRINKWMSRNRSASLIGIISILSLIIIVLLYTNELKKETERAQGEAMRATRIASVLGSSLRSIDPMQNGGQELTARSMVDMSTFYINNQLESDPETRSELLIMMANIYTNLLALDEADSLSALALHLFRNTKDTTSYTYIDMLSDRSIILDKAGKYEEGLAMIHRAIDMANQYLEPNSLQFAGIHLDYTYHLDANQEYALADSVLMMVQPIYEKNREAAAETYDDFIFYLGTNYRRTGDYEKAEEYLFRSLELSKARYPDVHEQIASTLNHISSLYQNMGEYEKSIPYAIESYQMRLKIFGPAHLNTLAAHSNTARAYSGAGQLEEAADTYRDVLAIFREEYGNENFYIAGILQSYGGVYLKMEDFEQAETIMRESLEHSERLLPADHIRQAYPLNGLADALRGQNRFEEALPYAQRAFELRNEQLADNNPELNTTRLTLGLCLWNLGRRDEAEPQLKFALAFYHTDPERYQEQIGEIEALGF